MDFTRVSRLMRFPSSHCVTDIVSDLKVVATTSNNLGTCAQETAGSTIHTLVRGAAEKRERGFRRLLWRAGFL